tara:strand:+ start:334 stop:525 length:192 start_codon:yes stop_codon:yes gene_type:complete
MIKKFLNWIKSLFGTGPDYRFVKAEGEPVVLEEAAVEESVKHCSTHLRFRKNCLDCLRVVAAI